MTRSFNSAQRHPAVLAAAAALFLAAAGSAAPAAAQQTREVTFKCESSNDRPARCGPKDAQNPRLIRQISNNPCIRGSTWGFDNAGVWVTGGCRAQFRASVPVSEIVVKCESANDQPARCGYKGATRVRLVRQISGSPCLRDQTWGMDSDGLWVASGCRGQFALYPATDDGTNGGGNTSGGGRNIVTCRSIPGDYTFCPVKVPKRVTVQRQLSNTRCREGRTWGYAHDGIWAANGCRARFRVE